MSSYEMPRVGDVIAGKYRLEKVAGEGGMGIVYAATHDVLKQRVAVKVLLPGAAQSEAVVERFAREAQAAARIQSEHVARVMDAGSTATGAPFLVMEYLEGCDLEELLALQGPLPLEEVVDYLIQALEALAHAHAVGIVHRDLKPANLFLACRPDGGNVIKMLDFGISKSVKATRDEKVLTGQAVLGSPIYMSPEQLRNAKEIDGRADLWSLGVVGYELLAGKPPFDGDGVGEIFAAVLEKTPEPLHTINWRLPPEISAVIAKCLERKVEERWADAHQLARALKPFGSGAWNKAIDRMEQVLVRANAMQRLETPIEARRVVDAIAVAAERARTTGGGTKAEPPDSKKSVELPLVTTKKKANDDATDTREDGISTRARGFVWRRPKAHWIGAAAALFVVVGLGAAATAAVRRSRPATPHIAPQSEVAAAAPPPSTGEPSEATGADEQDGAPIVMDLPDTPGKTGPSQRRSGKPGKPHRPKFLNTRE
ncbi:MAG: serine/threonine protein kinase [Deltaproteobacteria bacterium]|nr:serine/threonine protein kinase [Deltaproteobacteria bacterium]